MVALLPLLAAACTNTEIDRVLTGPAPERFAAVHVLPLSAEDEAWAGYAVVVRRAMMGALAESGAFPEVLDALPEVPPPRTLLVRGALVEVERGSLALRVIMGFGLGQSRMTADVTLGDERDITLGRFRITQTYGGGLGAGGPDLVSLEELAAALGQAAARRIVTWAETGRIEPGVAP